MDDPDVVKIQLTPHHHARGAFGAGFERAAMLAVANRVLPTVANLPHPHYRNAGNLAVGVVV